MNVFDHNRRAWELESRGGSRWCVPVDSETISRARRGDWHVVLTPNKPVPRSWFADPAGLRVLCLASGGGQQAPVLAAAGAVVTSLDASAEQLAKDHLVANREGLDLRCVVGDMCDLSVFADAAFDLIFHPCSNLFVADVMPVWRECARVLRPGGALLAGFMNPAYFLFDHDDALRSGELRVVYPQPFSDLVHAGEGRVRGRITRDEALVFGHTLEQQIGGQLRAGFALEDLYEDGWSVEATPLDRYTTTSIATRAVRRARMLATTSSSESMGWNEP
ncbi:MAG: class I SAM-dependent methyltransferase [Piscinibacter sp.]|uniref:class I SAM-dependent methyltransferase n=1 Tax=Piscinibacter sp. TaxID=1903157 RepID=UPI00258F79B1|nr:class I SAM-dependent methyltransferase [Piscinibacter sp.]MCW5667512.1 class I SAM-dependent methyltransferase [Piscinibacter sp.]